jgi:hypothetical protein
MGWLRVRDRMSQATKNGLRETKKPALLEGLMECSEIKPMDDWHRQSPMTTRALSQVRPVPRRGLSRDEAAMYIGVSAGKFDELVADSRMPGPVKIDSRKVWDVRSLDLAFDALPRENPLPNSWDGV